MPTEFTKVVANGTERVCSDFSELIAVHGFKRTKKKVWTRRNEHTIEIISFFRKGSTYINISYEVGLRVLTGIHVLNDSLSSSPRNGPCSDDAEVWSKRYHHRFNALSGSTYDRCLIDLMRFVNEVGMPWFVTYRQPTNLLNDSSSPIGPTARAGLGAALNGDTDSRLVMASLKDLGIKVK